LRFRAEKRSVKTSAIYKNPSHHPVRGIFVMLKTVLPKALLGAMMPVALVIACFIGAVMNHPAHASDYSASAVTLARASLALSAAR
jgi:hypothetical protein